MVCDAIYYYNYFFRISGEVPLDPIGDILADALLDPHADLLGEDLEGNLVLIGLGFLLVYSRLKLLFCIVDSVRYTYDSKL